MARKSFKNMATEKLMQAMGMSYENASKLQRRLYRQVLWRTRATTTTRGKTRQHRPFNVSRELYYSLTSPSGSIKFSQDFMNVSNISKTQAREILKSRMKTLIKKTGGMKGDVGTAINDYLKGNITYKEMKEIIAEHKRTAEYKSRQKESVKK